MCTDDERGCLYGKCEKVASQKDGQAQAPQAAQKDALETTPAAVIRLKQEQTR
jgi:hypothetical protein